MENCPRKEAPKPLGIVGRRGPYLPRELRIKLYDEIRMLRRRGLSYKRIIEAVRERYGVCLRKSNISDWTRGIHSPYNGIHIPSAEFLKPSRELAYIIGVVAGDGYIRRRSKPRKYYNPMYIGLKVKDREFAEEFSRCLGTVLKRKPPKLGWLKGLFVVELQCKVLYELLKKPLDIERIKRFIEHSIECRSAFLRGFFDSEGSINKTGEIRVYNTDLKLLRYVKLLLSSLKIETSGPRLKTKHGKPFIDPRGKTYYTKKDCYCLYIPSDYRLNFYKYIGFTIKRKQQRLEDFLIRTGRLSLQPNLPYFFLHSYLDEITYTTVQLYIIEPNAFSDISQPHENSFTTPQR